MTKEYQEAERWLREHAILVGDVELCTQVARLEAANERLAAALGDWPADAHSDMYAFLKDLQSSKAVRSECNCGFQAREAVLSDGGEGIEARGQVTRVQCTYCGVVTESGRRGQPEHRPDCDYLRATKVGWKDEMEG